MAVFPSAAAVADTEIQATPLADRITQETHALIVADTEQLLGEYADESGLVHVPIRTTLIAARNRGGPEQVSGSWARLIGSATDADPGHGGRG